MAQVKVGARVEVSEHVRMFGLCGFTGEVTSMKTRLGQPIAYVAVEQLRKAKVIIPCEFLKVIDA